VTAFLFNSLGWVTNSLIFFFFYKNNNNLGPEIFVCEITGSDETGKGSKNLPFKTPVKAFESQQGGPCQILIRKVTEEEFKVISQAAYKKAKKGYEVNEKKKKKLDAISVAEAEVAKQQALEEEQRLEEAKKVILTEDLSLPKAVKVRIQMNLF